MLFHVRWKRKILLYSHRAFYCIQLNINKQYTHICSQPMLPLQSSHNTFINIYNEILAWFQRARQPSVWPVTLSLLVFVATTSLEADRFDSQDAIPRLICIQLSPQEVLLRSTHLCRDEILGKERFPLAFSVKVTYHITKCLAFKMRKEVNTKCKELGYALILKYYQQFW